MQAPGPARSASGHPDDELLRHGARTWKHAAPGRSPAVLEPMVRVRHAERESTAVTWVLTLVLLKAKGKRQKEKWEGHSEAWFWPKDPAHVRSGAPSLSGP